MKTETCNQASTLEQRLVLPYWRVNFTKENRVIRTFRDSLPDLTVGNILDMGCNEGLTTEELQELYPGSRVVGIDIDKERVKEALKNKRKGNFLVSDGYQPPFRGDSFDLVFCMNNIAMMSDINDETYRNMLSGITRVLKPGGKLLVSNGGDYVILTKTLEGFVLRSSSIEIAVKNGLDPSSTLSTSPLCQITHILTGEYPSVKVIGYKPVDNMNSYSPKKIIFNSSDIQINRFIENSILFINFEYEKNSSRKKRIPELPINYELDSHSTYCNSIGRLGGRK